MKYSIKTQFVLVFLLLMLGTIGLCWFINSTFLEKYYLHNKQEVLMSAYQYMNGAAADGTLSTDDFDVEFQKICEKNSISFILLDAEARTLKTSSNDYEMLSRELLNNLFGKNTAADIQILEDGKNYEISIIMDSVTKTEFLEMWGLLDNGNLFLFRNPLESIKESVSLANRFLAYVGIAAAILSAVVVIIVASAITKPIKKLTQISERMIHLDFDAKYNGKSHTEIALLGHNIN